MSRRIIFLCIIVSIFSLNLPIDAQEKPELRYQEGELIVRFAPKYNKVLRTKSEMNILLNSIEGGTISRNSRLVPGLTLVKLPSDKRVENVQEIFNNTNGILYAEPNYKLHVCTTEPNDTYFNELWGMHNMGQTGGTEDADIDAPEAWEIRTNVDPNIIVAVIDTGVDYNHPDLADNMWINEAEFNGDPNVDDDGNYFYDDIYGYDFVNDDSDPYDNSYSGHGSHCAGIIGAIGDNNEGVVGVCWNVNMMSIKSFLTRLYPCDKVKWSYLM